MPILIGTIGRLIQNRSKITHEIIEAGQKFVGNVREALNSKSPKLVTSGVDNGRQGKVWPKTSHVLASDTGKSGRKSLNLQTADADTATKLAAVIELQQTAIVKANTSTPNEAYRAYRAAKAEFEAELDPSENQGILNALEERTPELGSWNYLFYKAYLSDSPSE